MNDENWHYYCYIRERMQGEKKKAKTRGTKGEKGRLDPGRPERIDEYNFFLAQEEALEEDFPEGKVKREKGMDRNKSMTFFLSK